MAYRFEISLEMVAPEVPLNYEKEAFRYRLRRPLRLESLLRFNLFHN